MTQYHDTHYMFFYQVLPQALRSEIFDKILSASKDGNGHALMIGFWRSAARIVSGVGLSGKLPRELDLTRDDFAVSVASPAQGWTFLVTTGPEVRGALEAAISVAAFEDNNPIASLKYFTCEAPAESGSPWMVGAWHADGSRSNLGPIIDVSTSAMVDFVCLKLGLRGTAESRAKAPQGIREIPNVDDLLGKKLQATVAEGGNPIGRKEGNKGLGVNSGNNWNLAPHSDSVPIPEGTGRITNSMTWNDSPSNIAQEAVMNLYRLRTGGKSAFVMSTKKASGLGKTVTSYVQFMWLESGDLLVELQADYSYWGLSVPSNEWSTLAGAGLARPNGENLNFHLSIPGAVDPSDRLNVLAEVFEVFNKVLRPTGKIQQSSF